MKVKKGWTVFWRHDLFPYVRWATCTNVKVRGRPGWVELERGYICIPRAAMPAKEAKPIIEALDVLRQQEYVARQALNTGFAARRDAIAPFVKSKEWNR